MKSFTTDMYDHNAVVECEHYENGWLVLKEDYEKLLEKCKELENKVEEQEDAIYLLKIMVHGENK